MNLVHLVSEQTLQNLIPLLALRPSTVIQIRSSDVRFGSAAENLKRAVASLAETQTYAGYSPEFIEQIIDEPMPSIDATRRKVAEALSGGRAQLSTSPVAPSLCRSAPGWQQLKNTRSSIAIPKSGVS